MEKFQFNLQFIDKGYGISSFSQTVVIDGMPLECEVKGLEKSDASRANELADKVWEWVSHHVEEIKTYLTRGLISSFNKMRQEGEKNVPYESYEMIRKQLNNINRVRINQDGRFELFLWVTFNGIKYQSYVTVDEHFTFVGANILTMGGFKLPKKEAKSELKKAAALYDYHINQGNEEGLYQHYIGLSAKEINTFIDLFIADQTDIDDRIDLVLYLALYSYACGEQLPNRLYDFLLEEEVYYYGEIYLRADESIAGKLISVLEGDDGSKADHLLCAISAIPCERTKCFLQQSSKEPLPQWAKKLHLLPIAYAKVSGWTLDENEHIVKLYTDQITVFKQGKKTEASPLAPVKSMDEVCGYCHQPLTLVFDGDKKLATCLYCSCYEEIFVKQDGESVHWHEKNAPHGFFMKHPEYMENEEDITERFEFAIKPSKEKRKPTYTAHQFAEISRTQIGGMPTAINDVNYPKCLDCGKTMHFVAQFDMEDIEEYGEGLYYFFTCDRCHVHATTYDQT